jgi:hypothetical protein
VAQEISSLRLGERYGIGEPAAPKAEPWGLTVLHVIDPSGALWHIAQPTRMDPTRVAGA